MTEQEAIEVLRKHKEIIDKEYFKARNSKAIEVVLNALEVVLNALEEKDKIIDLMLEYISNTTDCPFENERKYLDCERMCDVRTDKVCWKQYFEDKSKEE